MSAGPDEIAIDVSSGVVLLRADGACLLQHRDDKPGLRLRAQWVFPGGHPEPGETLEACARRELFEETGYRAFALDEVATVLEEEPGFPRSQMTFFGALYDGTQPISCFEGQAITFVARRDLAALGAPRFVHDVWDAALGRFALSSRARTI